MKRLSLALILALASAACVVDDPSEPADMTSLRESRPLGAAKALRVDLRYGVGSFELSKGQTDELFALDLEYDRQHGEPRISVVGDSDPTLRFDLTENRRIRIGRSLRDRGELALKLNDSIPLDLDLTTGVSESRLDMTDLKVRNLRLRGGVGRTEVSFDSPSTTPLDRIEVEAGVGEFSLRGLGYSRFRHLEIKGGVGKTSLDFTGGSPESFGEAEISVGVGSVHLLVPRDVPVEIEGSGSFLSNVNAPGFSREGNRYTHAVDAGGRARLLIRVRTGLGAISVDLI